ncbi:phospholipid carrier-dependent glycosyltransferase [Dethiosulfatarculus sandiegensis]|uniref:ArnT-like N-terminal domain-containing protein n=1 Tax=Dethiosulfatarculus sandiegensis TaxID=1429043 RepID=A0A0D2GKC8_9BACT|nr:phospholipid carrier-dependent glycosyltransferase [Dethiosulfatarculus sandiegensis]KIX15222.1 hypothetical protein X474_05105 [Dethiosulfatarculus sandiegensis]
MNLLPAISPRRVVLAVFMLMALGLRLWGLGWGPGEPLEAGQWTWSIVESLSLYNLTSPQTWNQAFFSLAALVQGVLSFVAGWTGYLLGVVKDSSDIAIPAYMAGRITVAFLGAGQTILAYLLGKKALKSPAAGLMAAALVGVHPLLTSQSHYLSLEIPLGFALLSCMLVAWRIADQPGPRITYAAGIILGLTITTHEAGIFALPILLLAYIFGVGRNRPKRISWALFWPIYFLGGLITGLAIGYPGFILEPYRTEDLLHASIANNLPAPSLLSFTVKQGLASTWSAILKNGTWLALILWAVSAIMMAFTRPVRRFLLLLVPPVFFVAGLITTSLNPMTWIAVWLPAALVPGVWPLIWLCRRMPHYYWGLSAAWVLGILVCLAPLIHSLETGYIFWQQDTLRSARIWLKENLKPEAPLFIDSYLPKAALPRAMAIGPEIYSDILKQNRGYLLHQPQENIPSPNLQRIKDFKFDADQMLPLSHAAYTIYAGFAPSRIKEPLALFRPAVGIKRKKCLVFGDDQDYSLNNSVIKLTGPQNHWRTLKLAKPPKTITAVLSNQGQDLAKIKISQGPFNNHQMTLYPGQSRSLIIKTRPWPPIAQGFLPVKAHLKRGDNLLLYLNWTPLLMARRALEAERFQEVVDHLLPLSEKGNLGFEGNCFLAEAYARLEKYKEAGWALAALGPFDEKPALDYIGLAQKILPSAKWDKTFHNFTGYHPALLRRSLSLCFVPDFEPSGYAPRQQTFKGKDFTGVYLRKNASHNHGWLKLLLEPPFPKGGLKARFHLTMAPGEKLAPQDPVVRLEFWEANGKNNTRLASRLLTRDEISQSRNPFELAFMNPREGAKLQARLVFLTSREILLEKLELGVNLAAHMRHVLRWYYDAWGRVSLNTGSFQRARQSFDSLLALDPDFRDAYLPLAKTLLDSGQTSQAYDRTKSAELLFRANPEQLLQVRDLYQLMGKAGDVARVDDSLAHLRPSLKLEARFAAGLELLGYDLPKAEVKPGQKLDVNYYWRCWSKPPMNYFIFVHLRGMDRTVTFDHLLDHGRQFMTELEPGQVIREDYQIRLPENLAPGEYKLVVGIWDPRFTGKGVPVIRGAGQGSEEVVLGKVKVLP